MSPIPWEQRLAQALELRHTSPAGRYAPSPTGPLHLGNLRTAVLAWLLTRLQGQRFILRMEDVDRQRSHDHFARQILHDLHWLGLDWDEGPDVGGPCAPYTQSEREEIYGQVLDLFKTQELVYPCYCSRKDIQEASAAPHTRQTIYPGTCRHLRASDIPARHGAQSDRHPAWRFRTQDRHISFFDQLCGRQQQKLEQEVGDFVLRRSDSLTAYQLAVVVDDALMGVGDVLRGVDLLDSSARQIALFNAIDFPAPAFWHVPLVLDQTGKRLAKRDHSHSLDYYRQQGYSAQQIIGAMAADLGFIDRSEPMSAKELLDTLDMTTFRTCLMNQRT